MDYTSEDWLPRQPELFAECLENFNAKLPGALAAKYNINAAEWG